MVDGHERIKSMNPSRYLFTSESVSMGHPDKVADQISDAILDHCLAVDPKSRVACETLVTTDLAVVAGEITTAADLSRVTVDKIVRQTVRDIGYVDPTIGFAHRLVENHARLRKSGALKSARPDAKSQVTVEYNADGSPHRIHTVVLSTQHDESVVVKRNGQDYFTDEARKEIIDKLILPA